MLFSLLYLVVRTIFGLTRGVQKLDRARMKADIRSSGTMPRRDPLPPLPSLAPSARPVPFERGYGG